MKIPVMDAVECVLLHNSFSPMAGDQLLQLIRECAAEFGIAQEVQPMVTSTEKDIHVLAGSYRIMVSQNEEPLGMGGFERTLSMPYTAMIFPNAQEVVANHVCNTFITFAKGVIDNSVMRESGILESLGDEIAGMNGITSAQEAEAGMLLCERIASQMMDHNAASAVHWCANDQLLTPTMFKVFADSEDKMPLYVNPYLFSESGKLASGAPLGVGGVGAQWLIGKFVSFDEAPVPFEWMYERIMQFIQFCQLKGEIIPDGETFGAHEGEVIHVRHIEPDGAPWGTVKLTITKSPEHGIDENPPQQLHIQYNDDGTPKNTAAQALNKLVAGRSDELVQDADQLDVNDPVDREILRRLEEQKVEADSQPEPEVEFRPFADSDDAKTPSVSTDAVEAENSAPASNLSELDYDPAPNEPSELEETLSVSDSAISDAVEFENVTAETDASEAQQVSPASLSTDFDQTSAEPDAVKLEYAPLEPDSIGTEEAASISGVTGFAGPEHEPEMAENVEAPVNAEQAVDTENGLWADNMSDFEEFSSTSAETEAVATEHSAAEPDPIETELVALQSDAVVPADLETEVTEFAAASENASGTVNTESGLWSENMTDFEHSPSASIEPETAEVAEVSELPEPSVMEDVPTLSSAEEIGQSNTPVKPVAEESATPNTSSITMEDIAASLKSAETGNEAVAGEPVDVQSVPDDAEMQQQFEVQNQPDDTEMQQLSESVEAEQPVTATEDADTPVSEAPVETAEAEQASEPFVPVEAEYTPPVIDAADARQKLNIADLRALAKKASEDVALAPSDVKKAGGGSFLKRARGMFAR